MAVDSSFHNLAPVKVGFGDRFGGLPLYIAGLLLLLLATLSMLAQV